MQGEPFVRNGKTLLSGIDPVRRCERTADAVAIKDRTLYFCPSPLYGYGLDRLLERIEKEAPSSAALCVEADAELYELSLKNIDPSLAQNKKLHITNIKDAAGICSLVREKWGAMAFRRVEIVRLSGGWQLFPEDYDSLCEALRSEIANDWGNAITLAKLGRLYIRNALRNLALLSRFPSIEKLSFGASPILVLGAGPSLDETLDALCRLFGANLNPEIRPFKIICVDTCLGALKDRQIIPDLAVILESQHWNMRDFIGSRGRNVPAAIDLSAHPPSAEILGGKGFLFMTPWTPLRIFERLKKATLLPAAIEPLGSVGLTAVELARRGGSGKIICSGIDFSFTADKYHARGTPGQKSRLNALTRLRGLFNTAAYEASSIAAVSKSGLSVRTNPIMQNYGGLFRREFSGDKRLFDIKGSGLPLGIKTLSLEDALSLLTAPLPSPPAAGAPRESAESYAEKTAAFIEDEIERLKELRGILTGEAADGERLNVLVDECDYLWAHFPDFSGGRRPDLGENAGAGAISFLKRLRAEIDPMVNLYTLTLTKCR